MTQNGATDLRVRRTRMLLRDALIDLATEKGFDAITVNDLAERAMINRATFYRHYRDKYELALDYATELLDELGLLDNPLLADTQQGDTDVPHPSLIRLFEHAASHARLYRVMLGQRGTPLFAEQLQRYVEGVMRERFVQAGRDRQRTRVPLDLCVHFMATNSITMLIWWLEQGQPYSAAQMATWLPQLNLRGVDYALGSEPPAAGR
jgi:AcrR family transcriptional regulator